MYSLYIYNLAVKLSHHQTLKSRELTHQTQLGHKVWTQTPPPAGQNSEEILSPLHPGRKRQEREGTSDHR